MRKENQIIFFKENLKFLRERRKLSQEQLSAILGFSRAKIAALESGHTKSPQPEDYLNISTYFKISVDSMLKVNLSSLGELRLRELEAGNDVYMMGSKIRVLAISVDKSNKENTEYVPIKAKAGYSSGHNDPEYIASLPKFNIPTLSRHGTYRTFPITGDSMLPIAPNSMITGSYVENWKRLKPLNPCIVILNGVADFVFKLVTVQDDGTILLTSLNKEYHPYTVRAEEVLEIWAFNMLHSKELPESPSDLEEIKTLINKLRKEISN
ncbi:MAG TPA: LexA family transcriptional regulator [Edaphocola sp.]|nr:LexA family transcriptional regulator [Edaphocola sp.]